MLHLTRALRLATAAAIAVLGAIVAALRDRNSDLRRRLHTVTDENVDLRQRLHGLADEVRPGWSQEWADNVQATQGRPYDQDAPHVDETEAFAALAVDPDEHPHLVEHDGNRA